MSLTCVAGVGSAITRSESAIASRGTTDSTARHKRLLSEAGEDPGRDRWKKRRRTDNVRILFGVLRPGGGEVEREEIEAEGDGIRFRRPVGRRLRDDVVSHPGLAMPLNVVSSHRSFIREASSRVVGRSIIGAPLL